MNPLQFIKEEVEHQGFIPGSVDFLLRVAWMEMAWDYARAKARAGRPHPTVGDLLTLGKQVEPHRNGGGFRHVDVRVGKQRMLPHAQVRGAISKLWEDIQTVDPLAFYVAFEKIHPFVDGNGRTGKILIAWLSQNFDDPEFPPDFFGNGLP